MDVLQGLLIFIGMSVVITIPALLFRRYLNRFGGMADVDEMTQIGSSFVKSEFNHSFRADESDRTKAGH